MCRCTCRLQVQSEYFVSFCHNLHLVCVLCMFPQFHLNIVVLNVKCATISHWMLKIYCHHNGKIQNTIHSWILQPWHIDLSNNLTDITKLNFFLNRSKICWLWLERYMNHSLTHSQWNINKNCTTWSPTVEFHELSQTTQFFNWTMFTQSKWFWHNGQ